ncbi:MAG: ABC transporter ATP-binding protein [Coprococcus phoceensis]
MSKMLIVNNLKKIYKNGNQETFALNGINFTVDKGEFVAIVGASGSGKSTLLNIIGGLDNPSSGDVILNGKNILEFSDEEKAIFRRKKIGFVFQNYNLIPALNVYENIVMPINLDGKKPEKEYFDKIVKVLKIEEKLNNMSNDLSGGQQQRVAIARALITKPDLLLADEPTGNLDHKTSLEVVDLLKYTNKKFNQTIIMITHDREIALMADRAICIEDGKIIEGR